MRREEHCYRCGYVWAPRRRRVRICPRCKSPHFSVPKLRLPVYGGGLGVEEIIGPNRHKVLQLARRWGATDVRVFGSVARHAAQAGSDIDVLVRPISIRLYSPVDLALALSRLLGRHADVVSEGSLHWLVEPQVVAEAVPV